MPKFSNQLLQGLTNPTYGDKLAQVGMLLGSAPRRAREEEAEQARYKEVASSKMRGVQRAQAGEVAGLDVEIAKLQEVAASAKTKEERAAVERDINSLLNLRSSALSTQNDNSLNAVLKFDTILEASESLNDEDVEAIKSKRTQLLENSKVKAAYNKAKIEQIQLNSLLKEQQSDEWLANTLPKAQALINAGQFKEFTELFSSSPDSVEAQRMSTAMLANKNQLDSLRDKNESRVIPSESYFKTLEGQLENLPEGLKENAESLLSAAREAAKGYKKDGTWTVSGQQYKKAINRAENAIFEAKNTVLVDNYKADTQLKRSLETQLRQVDLNEAEGVSQDSVTSYAKALHGKEPTEKEMGESRRTLQAYKRITYNKQRAILKKAMAGEKDVDLFDVDTLVSRVSAAKESGAPSDQVFEMLRDSDKTSHISSDDLQLLVNGVYVDFEGATPELREAALDEALGSMGIAKRDTGGGLYGFFEGLPEHIAEKTARNRVATLEHAAERFKNNLKSSGGLIQDVAFDELVNASDEELDSIKALTPNLITLIKRYRTDD